MKILITLLLAVTLTTVGCDSFDASPAPPLADAITGPSNVKYYSNGSTSSGCSASYTQQADYWTISGDATMAGDYDEDGIVYGDEVEIETTGIGSFTLMSWDNGGILFEQLTVSVSGTKNIFQCP